MKAYSKLPDAEGLTQLAQDQRRQGWALVVTGASTMLAGLVIGYAFGAAKVGPRRDGHAN
jgi:curli biogenesis system outer membrane secretion channel CsgG